MGKFYGTRIMAGDICRKTGLPWHLSDVPVQWRHTVMDWIRKQAKCQMHNRHMDIV